jgi:hypothetical protein
MKHTILIFSITLACLLLLFIATHAQFHSQKISMGVLGKFTVVTAAAQGK